MAKKVNRAPLVYLAGPVRGIGIARAIEVRTPLARALVKLGMSCFSPAGAWISNPTDDASEETVQGINNVVMLASDEIAFIYVPEHTEASLGSAEELATCLRAQRSVSLVCYEDDSSAALAWVNRVMADHGVDWQSEGRTRMRVTIRNWDWTERSTVDMPDAVHEVAG